MQAEGSPDAGNHADAHAWADDVKQLQAGKERGEEGAEHALLAAACRRRGLAPEIGGRGVSEQLRDLASRSF